jgi:hypothetical protein
MTFENANQYRPKFEPFFTVSRPFSHRLMPVLSPFLSVYFSRSVSEDSQDFHRLNGENGGSKLPSNKPQINGENGKNGVRTKTTLNPYTPSGTDDGSKTPQINRENRENRDSMSCVHRGR